MLESLKGGDKFRRLFHYTITEHPQETGMLVDKPINRMLSNAGILPPFNAAKKDSNILLNFRPYQYQYQ
jgi:hypothetical protein